MGKTLLTAFLLLAIVPLSLLATFTYHRIQKDTRHKIAANLETALHLKEAHLLDWVEGYERELGLIATTIGEAGAIQEGALRDALAFARAGDPALSALIVLDENSDKIRAASEGTWYSPATRFGRGRLSVVSWPEEPDPSFVAISGPGFGTGERLVALLPWTALQEAFAEREGTEAEVTTYLVTSDGWVISGYGLSRLPPDRPVAGDQRAEDSALLTGSSILGAHPDGVPVFLAYHWSPQLEATLWAEQPQTQALASGSNLTATLVASALAMALVTVAVAAVVTRRLTHPIVQLTETAALMARGDLDQTVPVAQQDEIGVLARAFNRMASELRVLYASLEAKVAERTRQLEDAKEEAHHHAMQLGISAEVARVATSIRDVDGLLSTVVGLMAPAFELEHVAIYVAETNGTWTAWEAGAHDPEPTIRRGIVDPDPLVQQVAASGCRQQAPAPQPSTTGIALPLQVRNTVLGVLVLQNSLPGVLVHDWKIYESLADQISVAIENARAYTFEHATVQRLQELDRIQSQFLTDMSHALRTPLTSIIGFSRLMLKELDGPLSDLQRADLESIHRSGQQLLGLLNDMLELSQLELGTTPLTFAETNLSEIIEGVVTTARALARAKLVQITQDVPAGLPLVYTDGRRVRQVILALLSNAVKFTDEGSIRLSVEPYDGYVAVSVQDSGVGIPLAQRSGIFTDNGGAATGESPPRFSLAISKRVVERLGGQIWVDSNMGAGSTFTFTLPLIPTVAQALPSSTDWSSGPGEGRTEIE